jgi:hypothetical protein
MQKAAVLFIDVERHSLGNYVSGVTPGLIDDSESHDKRFHVCLGNVLCLD